MKIDKNITEVSYWVEMQSHVTPLDEIKSMISEGVKHAKEIAAVLKLLDEEAYDNATIKMHFDGFILKIDGHHGDVAWHEGTMHMYETYGTIEDYDDVTRHENVTDAVLALLRTPADYEYVEPEYEEELFELEDNGFDGMGIIKPYSKMDTITIQIRKIY